DDAGRTCLRLRQECLVGITVGAGDRDDLTVGRVFDLRRLGAGIRRAGLIIRHHLVRPQAFPHRFFMLGGLSLAAGLFVSRGLAAGFFGLSLSASLLGRHLRLQRASLRIEIRALLHGLIDIIGLLRAVLVVSGWR